MDETFQSSIATKSAKKNPHSLIAAPAGNVPRASPTVRVDQNTYLIYYCKYYFTGNSFIG